MRCVRALGVAALALIGAVLLGAQAGAAGLRLPVIFADHGVLQQNAAVPVWGWGEPGQEVAVAIADQVQRTTVNADGRWRVDLAPMPAGGPYEMTVTSAGDAVTLTDILIGEVWLASGQSNMQWSIKLTDNWEEEAAQCDNDAIRFAMLFREHSPAPLEHVRGLTPWAACSAKALNDCCNGEGFSGVSYYFAKYLQAGLGVPVGIINTSWGGTRIEPWTPPEGFAQVPALADIAATVRMNTPDSADFQAALRKAIADAEAWIPEAKQALTDGAFPPALPVIASESALKSHQSPTTLYNAMVHPLVPYANRGFLWYQGESNRGEGMLYRDKMEALIKGWRSRWQQDDLACYFVQLAPYDYGNAPHALPEIWEAQTATLDIPGTGMAVVNDIANIKNIHPRNKDDVGKRLAALALNKTYDKKEVVCDSPLFDRVEVEGNALRVHLKHARALKTRDGAAPNWFRICGLDGVYRAADAAIDGTSVVLTAEGVDTPVAVRFAWDHCAEPNLMNEAGLPASPFRAGSVPVDGPLRYHVPEAEGFELVYALDPTHCSAPDGKVTYDVDRHESLAGKRIERVAYFMHLVTPDEQTRWVYCEMNPLTQDPAQLGVPAPDKSGWFQQDLKGLVVKSSVGGLPSGARAHGAIEAWACNYSPQTSRALAGASADLYDFDDTMGPDVNPGYGCLQIHDVESRTTLLAFNSFRAGHSADVGIGNAPGKQPDWTFSKSAEAYASGQLLILAKIAEQ